jgi:hypothetical protein
MSTGAKVGIAVGVGLVALVVLSIVAAVAVPVFQSQKARSEAARTTVELPDRIGSFGRVSGSAEELVRQQARAVPEDWGTPQTAVYGTGSTPRVIILAGAHVIVPAEQSNFLAGATRTAKLAGFTLEATDPGPLGGHLICGADANSVETACIFVDSGAYGRIEVVGVGSAAVDLVHQVRAAIEHRS